MEYYRDQWQLWLRLGLLPLALLPLVSRMKTCQDNETMVTDLIPGSKYKFRILSASIAGISEPSQESEEVRRVGGRL